MRVDVPVVGDVKRVLAVMNKVLKEEVKEQWGEVRKAWLKQIGAWRRKASDLYSQR